MERLWLTKLREKQGLTPSELAEKVDVTRQMIWSIEKGSRRPSMGLAFKIAETLHFDVNKFDEKEK